ncbi:MAG: PmoA family protein [Gemmatimonadetes bacterium]|nr:PmoA family protein [Gemmatimonadota bacterium]
MPREAFKRNLSHIRLEVNEWKGFEVYAGRTGQADRQLLARYNAETDPLPKDESPKPCFHPIYTPSGSLISEYRPEDHTWHTGLYFGWVHVNDTNFWGGSWYLPEQDKYVPVPGSHGVQRHDGFTEVSDPGSGSDPGTVGVAIGEHLTWLDRYGRPVIREVRRFDFLEITAGSEPGQPGQPGQPGGCLWLIDSVITPVEGDVTLGASRAARYSGLILRMGAPFADAHHTSGSGLIGHESIMRTRDRWVAAAGAQGGMVVMMDHPRNLRHPVQWFTRRNLLGTGPLMEEDLTIPASDRLHLRYGFLVLDEVASAGEIEDLYRSYVSASDEHTPS